uniref:Uncharacterized protein n=1 Tax=Anguilla anguilla TaxID=7936 RepID=A0A0E9U7V1_ANGAN
MPLILMCAAILLECLLKTVWTGTFPVL